MTIDEKRVEEIKADLRAVTDALDPAGRLLATGVFREALRNVRDVLIGAGLSRASAGAVATTLMGAEFYRSAHGASVSIEGAVALQLAASEIGRALTGEAPEAAEGALRAAFSQPPGRA